MYLLDTNIVSELRRTSRMAGFWHGWRASAMPICTFPR
jgi:predicted nucleic acid-binding protein